ncbi:ABC transporter ATP-binding protein [Derxia lacustris]|uniref:ABC transporter ATP-binding protein n=1 Tax=Derxia lacustris TaxID=764842 RepID=UPI000A173877|nr:sn-glycerol-3-phosphate ABC transporter ATP-binding protein UgpC [Derxia lacustris]
MASVTLREIRKRYDSEHEVIRGIDLDVKDGEFMVFVGPSGCGKSTLLRMIAGLEDISAGELRIGDRLANDLPPVDRKVAMVFQSYALYPHMTVAENMGFGLKLARQPRAHIAERVAEVARVLQLDKVLDRYPKALSGGQRQRVAIGRAILRSPEVFLLDEPLSNLDATLRVQMRIELTRLHRELGSTMIYVTHDQTEAMTMGDRIAVFNGGHVEQVGAPMDLYRDPANVFVAGFLGSPRMNFIPAWLVPGTDRWWVELGEAGGFGTPAPADTALGQGRQLGIRPEGFDFVEPGQGWRVTTEFVEHLGDTELLYCRMPGVAQPLCIKQPDGAVAADIGSPLHLRPKPGACHVFDSDGRRLGCF